MDKQKKFDDYYQNYFGQGVSIQDEKGFQLLQDWYFNWLKFIQKKINLNKFKRESVLELGGGIGSFCKLLEDEGFKKITLNDISPQALKLAKKFNPKLKTNCFDIEKIKEKNLYNLIFAFEVLEHLDKSQLALKKIFALLKPGGIFITSTPYPFPKNFQDPTHKHVLKPEKWQEYFRKEGFKKIKIYPMSFPPFLYRLNKHLNFCLPVYFKNQYFVSTTLIIASSE